MRDERPGLIGTVIAVLLILAFVTIPLFKKEGTEANRSAIQNDIRMISGQAVLWSKRPKIFVGGGGRFDGFIPKGFEVDSTDSEILYKNENGAYKISITNDGKGLIVTAKGATNYSDVPLTVKANIDQYGNIAWADLEGK